MTFPDNDPLLKLKKRATLRFKWALHQGGLCHPDRMRELMGEIIHNELSALTDADMIEFARRYRGLNRPQGIVPDRVAKEPHVREALRELLNEHLGTVLWDKIHRGAQIRIRVQRDSIKIVGIGKRPSRSKPDPRNAGSTSPKHSHCPLLNHA